MVGSNSFSGLGRFALCESLETRNFFSAVTLDSAFRGGAVQTRFGGTNEYATAATVLTSGRLLVGGASSFGDGLHDVFALYNRDGTLSNSFDGDGKLTLTQAQYELVGAPQKIVTTSDGGAVVQGVYGIVKITAAGKVDTTFGGSKTGFISYSDPYSVADLKVKSDGSICLLVDGGDTADPSNTTHFIQFDSHGNGAVLAQIKTVGPTRFTSDGNAITTTNPRTGNYIIYGLTDTLERRSTFGTEGAVNLTAAYHKWAAANGPFQATPAQTDNQGYPQLTISAPQVTADGGLLFRVLTRGSSPKVPANGYGVTTLFVTVDPTGKVVTFHNGPATGGGAVVTSDQYSSYRTSATIYLTEGSPATLNLYNGQANFQGFTTDSTGATYLVGEAPFGTTGNNAFVVARVLPYSGSVSGVLFNDKNGNQKQDAGEAAIAGRQVYVDRNGNNVFDQGETTTLTSASGKYIFAGLAPGSYAIRQVLPSGFHTTTSLTAVSVTVGKTTTYNIGSNNLAVTKIKDQVLT